MPRIIGIVGSEDAKFTPYGETRARELITALLLPVGTILTSGHCHLGGIDIYAEEIAELLGREKIIFPPKNLAWSTGYKPRNIKIARACTELHNITVDQLPDLFAGMRFKLCYHCGTDTHVKSGGCWTAKQVRLLGKPATIHVVKNYA
jgi:hypothetical protein